MCHRPYYYNEEAVFKMFMGKSTIQVNGTSSSMLTYLAHHRSGQFLALGNLDNVNMVNGKLCLHITLERIDLN